MASSDSIPRAGAAGPARAARWILALRAWLALCAVGAVGLGLHMARPWDGDGTGGHLALAGFLLFAVSPYVAMAWLAGLFARSGVALALWIAGAACIGLSGTAAIFDAALIHLDAQGALVFVFAPLAQWGAALVLAALCGVVWLASRRRGAARPGAGP